MCSKKLFFTFCIGLHQLMFSMDFTKIPSAIAKNSLKTVHSLVKDKPLFFASLTLPCVNGYDNPTDQVATFFLGTGIAIAAVLCAGCFAYTCYEYHHITEEDHFDSSSQSTHNEDDDENDVPMETVVVNN